MLGLIANLAHAPGQIDIRVTTAFGGESAIVNDQTNSDTFTFVAAQPQVTGLNPPGGPATGGGSTTISGLTKSALWAW